MIIPKQSYVQDTDLFEQKLRKPEENLLIAIINRAVHDFAKGDHIEKRTAKTFLYKKKLKSGKAKDWSFLWMCEILGYDPTAFLKVCREVEDCENVELSLMLKLGLESFNYAPCRGHGRI